MIDLALIGCGNWGAHLARNISGVEGVKLCALVDSDLEKARRLKSHYPSAKVFSSAEKIFKDNKIKAVVIATPAKSHYLLAKMSLETGKHVLIEKPLALSSNECQSLIEIARKKKRILMVGHTFLYHLAVITIKRYIDSGKLGNIYYIFSQRLNLGPLRDDVDVMWDFAPHDISIILYLVQDRPVQVRARGFSFWRKGIPDLVFLDIDFKNGLSTHIQVSRLDPLKIRKMVVVGSKKMAVFDDVSRKAKLRLYDRGIESAKLRRGDMFVPSLNFVEPLQVECRHFIESIKNKRVPLADGKNGYEVVRILEAATESIKRDSAVVKLAI